MQSDPRTQPESNEWAFQRNYTMQISFYGSPVFYYALEAQVEWLLLTFFGPQSSDQFLDGMTQAIT
jgi:hypothetical protein